MDSNLGCDEMAILKVNNGGFAESKAVKRWDGSSWVDVQGLKVYNNGTWNETLDNPFMFNVYTANMSQSFGDLKYTRFKRDYTEKILDAYILQNYMDLNDLLNGSVAYNGYSLWINNKNLSSNPIFTKIDKNGNKIFNSYLTSITSAEIVGCTGSKDYVFTIARSTGSSSADPKVLLRENTAIHTFPRYCKGLDVDGSNNVFVIEELSDLSGKYKLSKYNYAGALLWSNSDVIFPNSLQFCVYIKEKNEVWVLHNSYSQEASRNLWRFNADTGALISLSTLSNTTTDPLLESFTDCRIIYVKGTLSYLDYFIVFSSSHVYKMSINYNTNVISLISSVSIQGINVLTYDPVDQKIYIQYTISSTVYSEIWDTSLAKISNWPFSYRGGLLRIKKG